MKNLFTLLSCLVSFTVFAQQQVINVYNGAAPGSETWTQKEVEFYPSIINEVIVRNVTEPSLTVFLPEKSIATGTAVIVAPGGGFRYLAWEKEGTKVAEWLQQHGITAFVLKYRLCFMGNTDEEFVTYYREYLKSFGKQISDKNKSNISPDSLVRKMAHSDALQAIKYVRQNASKFNIEPNKIGMIGFSAGGMITMAAILDHDAESRLDFAANVYGPVSTNIIAPGDAPPLFFVGAANDILINKNCPSLITAWLSAGKSIEFHLYSAGNHGFGMRKSGLPVDTWIERFGDWLKQKSYMK